MKLKMPASRTIGATFGVTLALAAGLCVNAVSFAAARAEGIIIHDAVAAT